MILHKLCLLPNKLRVFQICRAIKTTPKFCTSQSPIVNTNLVKDVILYKYDNPRFFKLLNIFAVCQFGFWTYLSLFAYTSLRDAPSTSSPGAPWYQRINLGENKYRNGIAFLSFLLGYGILAISWMYTLRSVRYLVLHKGGSKVTFVTYAPFGVNRMMTVGLENMSCQQTRQNATTQLPIKVKNRFMYYILDMKGEFKNAALFDYTAGLKRTLK
ncbi:hypothetical protein PPYR_14590 [Photinus pyralis]|uniref:Transmembrane protein 223 n=1 Tax=Photinus pyralis TaxID=7054 RepID=A0A1Y1K5Q3_PHOPY|nr:transmembrane protein 223 [Photinus pyralis]KAB0792631.1 hypothetical protein PPYR_14590 [Photinus pyralis]